MAVVHRRVFIGKIGVADQIVKVLKEGERLFKGYGLKAKMRVLADFNTGRTDRVVWEWELPSLRDLEEQEAAIMAKGGAAKTFDAWFKKLTPLIHYAEAENWTVK